MEQAFLVISGFVSAVSLFPVLFFLGVGISFSPSLMKTCRLFLEQLQWKKLLFLLKMAKKSSGFIQTSFSFAICSPDKCSFHGKGCDFVRERERGTLW